MAQDCDLNFQFNLLVSAYTIHNLEMKDQGDGFAELLSELGFVERNEWPTATYNF